MAVKYKPLAIYIQALPRNKREVRLSFEQIEGIINSKLPSSAYEDDRWWMHKTEGNHRNTRA